MSPRPEVSILDNGLQIISLHLPGRRSTALGVGLYNGARHQHAHQDGYAHLLEHLLFKGRHTPARAIHGEAAVHPGTPAPVMTRHFEAMGGEVNAYTDRELTVLHGQVPGSEAPALLSHFIDMLIHPGFTDADLAHEVQVIAQEQASLGGEDELEDVLLDIALGHHPLSRPILGAPLSMHDLSVHTLHHYLAGLLQGERLCVVAVGEVSHTALLTACRPLAGLARGARPTSHTARFLPRRRSLPTTDTGASTVWAMPAPAPAHPDYVASLFANHLLGGGTTSRLYQSLRAQHACTYALHSRLDFYSDTGLWFIEARCAAAQVQAVNRHIEHTLDTLARQGPAPEELATARAHLQARLLLEQDRPEALMQRLLREAFYRPAPLNETDYLHLIAQVSAPDVQRVFTRAHGAMACVYTRPVQRVSNGRRG